MSRGSIIVVEGLDRTGKSTQVELLLKQFQAHGKKVELVKFPDRTTEIGKLINEYLTNKNNKLPKESVHLLFSANRWEVKSAIIDKLQRGVNIVMDRYYYSGIAYSAANGLDFQWCKNPDIGLPAPDLTVFLSFQQQESVRLLESRENYGEERYEVVEFQQKVRLAFDRFFQGQKRDDFEVVYVDGKGIEEVKELVWHVVKKYVEEDNTNELKYFK